MVYVIYNSICGAQLPIARCHRHPQTTGFRQSETYQVSRAILVLKFLYVSCRNPTSVSVASTGSGVDVTSNVSEARNSDAADLGWQNILVSQFELEENKWCKRCLKEWSFGCRFDYSRNQGTRMGESKQNSRPE